VVAAAQSDRPVQDGPILDDPADLDPQEADIMTLAAAS
jgi:hypothetical protein